MVKTEEKAERQIDNWGITHSSTRRYFCTKVKTAHSSLLINSAVVELPDEKTN